MTLDEVVASIGPPDKRSSKVTQEGCTDTLEFIAYERVPRTGVSYDSFGVYYYTTSYINLENDTVTAIEETEGVDLAQNGGAFVVVPPPVFLF